MFCYQLKILPKKWPVLTSTRNTSDFNLSIWDKVTICNVSMQLSGDVPEANLSDNGGVEIVTQIKLAHGTALIMCLPRGEFQAIQSNTRQWWWQWRAENIYVGHVYSTNILHVPARRKIHLLPHNIATAATAITTTTTTTTNSVTDTVARRTKTSSEAETGDHPSKEERWTQVTRIGGKKMTNPSSNFQPVSEEITKPTNKTSTITAENTTELIEVSPSLTKKEKKNNIRLGSTWGDGKINQLEKKGQ